MTFSRFSRLAALALGLAATTIAVMAAAPAARTIEVPAGAIVLVIPAGGAPTLMPQAQAGFVSPVAMMRQIDQMMQSAFAGPSPDQLIESAMRQMQGGVPMSGMMVATFRDGASSCTRQVIYSGDPAAPKIDVRMTGNACPAAGVPAFVPDLVTPVRQPAHTIRVDRAPPAPIQVAQLSR